MSQPKALLITLDLLERWRLRRVLQVNDKASIQLFQWIRDGRVAENDEEE